MKMTTFQKIAGCVLCLIAPVFFAKVCTAQTGVTRTLVISPTLPTVRDAIVLRLEGSTGLWEPYLSRVAMTSNKITVSFFTPCIVALVTPNMTSDPIEFTVGRLPVGRYELEVRRNDCAATPNPSGYVIVGTTLIDVAAGSVSPRASAFPLHDFTDIWWTATESGWGISVHTKGSKLFAAWFAYNSAGNPVWYTLQGGQWSEISRYTGKVYQSTGPYFGGPFNPATVTATEVGTGSMIFTAYDKGTLEFTVNGVTVKKEITRTPF
jgi:hypothetical protein